MGHLKNYVNQINKAKHMIPNCGWGVAIIVPFDVRHWSKKYQLLESEYYFYEFYKKDKKQRLDYVRDYECMHNLPNTFNDQVSQNILDDKSVFAAFFSQFFGREHVLINSQKYEEFIAFSKKHPEFMFKPLNNLGGFGIQKITMGNVQDVKQLFLELTSNGDCLLEEIIVQHPQMSALNPDTLNTLRVVTMVDAEGKIHVPLANVRIGRSGACVDNFCSGGMSARIDVSTGIISSKAYTKNMDCYSVHPDTQCQILGYQIPKWEDVLTLVKSSAKMLPQLRYIGWDVAVKIDGSVCLVEGNHNAGSDVHQVAAGEGLRSLYEQYLGKWS